MYNIEHYFQATSIENAITLLSENPQARLLSGGTDVLIQLHHMSEKYKQLVDVHLLPELKAINLSPEGVIRIGSGVTFTEIIQSPIVQQHIPALAQAVSTIAGPQIRNVATLGGNICNGATSADSVPVSIVLGAEIEIAGPTGLRRVPLEGFHTGPGKIALAHNEMATAFHFYPEHYEGYGASYYKYAMRAAMDIATIGCAAACKLDAAGRFTVLKLAYGVAAPTPIRTPTAEAAALGKPFNAETLRAVQEAVVQDVNPRSSWRASKEFRLQIIRTLAARVITQAAAQIGGKIE